MALHLQTLTRHRDVDTDAPQLWPSASGPGQATTDAASLGGIERRVLSSLRAVVGSEALCLNLDLVLSEDHL